MFQVKFFVALLIGGALLVSFADAQRCVRHPGRPVGSIVKSPMPHTYVNFAAMPETVNWCNTSTGENFCSSSRNQHIPQYCGSCWACASTSALADRIRIVRQSRYPDFEIALQTIVYCVAHGCNGGLAELAYEYIAANGVGPDTCQNYVALGSGRECSAIHRCQNCRGFNATCNAVSKFPLFGVAEHGTVLGVEQMKAEIYARGTIACYVNANPIWEWGFGPHSTDIFSSCSGKSNASCGVIDHVISVTGFSRDASTGQQYWIVRNSWGEYWGINGFFKLEMGSDQLGIESTPCAWALPTIPPLPTMP